jgi:sulfate permease, SulP family
VITRRFGFRDMLAGVSVALILIPQSMALAELAGLPPKHGLYAAALGPIAAAFLASSPFLQTGPVALTALLTLGALLPLAVPKTIDYVALAALLALLVGITRIAVSWIRAGWVSYLMSRPMLDGFTSGAAILILASQLPVAFGVDPEMDGVLQRAVWTLGNPASWEWTSVVIAVLTIGVIRGSRRVHRLLPGVLIATVAALAYSLATGYEGPVVGSVTSGLPPLMLALPYTRIPELFLAAIVIALVGFAEAASISRMYAAEERIPWDPNREFLSQGAANVAAGLFGGMPVGGSFSRSSVNHLAGAQTRWSGGITGVTVLLFLPFAGMLEALPKAVLGAIVIAAIAGLIRLKLLVRLWRISHAQSFVGWTTGILTLALAPRIEQAVLIGILVSIGVHIWRELKPGVESEVIGEVVHLRPTGVLWFGSSAFLETALVERLSESPQARLVEIHLEGLGRIDVSGALGLKEFVDEGRRLGLEVELSAVPEHAKRVMDSLTDVQVARDPD